MGIFEEADYDEWGVTLNSGDILVFHSDGIAEASNSEGQFFGTERLRTFIEERHEVSATELSDAILLSDDRTLVIVKVR